MDLSSDFIREPREGEKTVLSDPENIFSRVNISFIKNR